MKTEDRASFDISFKNTFVDGASGDVRKRDLHWTDHVLYGTYHKL